jgi:hypothetical protein
MSERLRKAFIDRYIPNTVTEPVRQTDEAITTAVTALPHNKPIVTLVAVISVISVIAAIWAVLAAQRNPSETKNRTTHTPVSHAFQRASMTAREIADDAFFSTRSIGQNVVGFDFTREFDASKKTFSFTLSENLANVQVIVKDAFFASNAHTPITITTKGNGQFVIDRSIIDPAVKALVNPYRITEIRIVLPQNVSIKQVS